MDNSYSWSASLPNADGTVFTDFLDDLNSTGFAGQHDWRLPTIFELHSIVSTDAAPCGTAPCVVDPLFLLTQSGFYWSSSTNQAQPLGVWSVGFGGNAGYLDKAENAFVRAVRAGS